MRSALRQYTGFDYFITFISFLLYSLPVFWVAVLLKQYGAIRFNNFLGDPAVGWTPIIVLTVFAGLFWMAALGGLAAGLLHEINNPAAAVSRSAARLRRLLGAEAWVHTAEAVDRVLEGFALLRPLMEWLSDNVGSGAESVSWNSIT